MYKMWQGYRQLSINPYKPLPLDENKEKVMGNEVWDIMCAQQFKEANALNITVSQHNFYSLIVDME